MMIPTNNCVFSATKQRRTRRGDPDRVGSPRKAKAMDLRSHPRPPKLGGLKKLRALRPAMEAITTSKYQARRIGYDQP